MESNRIHLAIVAHIRKTATEEMLLPLTDDQILRQMFYNYRSGKGLRLTILGIQIMRNHFEGYEIKVPDDEQLKPAHLIYLDQNAKMPYYCGKDEIVVYDHWIGMKLKLVDGRLSQLMRID